MLSLRKGGHRDLEKYYSLLEMDFDSRELLPRLAIHKAMIQGEQEFLIIFDEETKMDVAYALIGCKSLYGYALVKYFGVMPWYRGQGMGVEAMRLINKRYMNKQGLIAELTSFDDEDGSYLRKLKKFFSRFGYVNIACDYKLGGAEVTLMVKPLKGTTELEPVAHRVILDFYTRCLSMSALRKMVDIKPIK